VGRSGLAMFVANHKTPAANAHIDPAPVSLIGPNSAALTGQSRVAQRSNRIGRRHALRQLTFHYPEWVTPGASVGVGPGVRVARPSVPSFAGGVTEV
jgi:hypothetical protein